MFKSLTSRKFVHVIKIKLSKCAYTPGFKFLPSTEKDRLKLNTDWIGYIRERNREMRKFWKNAFGSNLDLRPDGYLVKIQFE